MERGKGTGAQKERHAGRPGLGAGPKENGALSISWGQEHGAQEAQR